MFQYENTIKGKMDIEKVWDLYSKVNRWSEWDLDMQEVVLAGEFAAGTKGTIFMKGMPPLPFVLDKVEKGKVFVNTSLLGEITVTFGHYLAAADNGECILKHTVTITGAHEAKLQEMGQGIIANIPVHMLKLEQLTRVD
jgi:hypothetical protein